MKAHVANGEPVPDVSRRQMKTFDLMIDEVMESMPREDAYDLGSDAGRERFGDLLRLIARRLAFQMEWAYRHATDSALTQASGLMENPDRYAKQKRQSKAARERYQADRAQQEADQATRRRERDESLRTEIEAGRLVPMPGLQLNPRLKRPEPTAVPDPEETP